MINKMSIEETIDNDYIQGIKTANTALLNNINKYEHQKAMIFL